MCTRVSPADGSDLGPLGIVLCSIKLGSCEFNHKFLLYRNLSVVILDLDFAKCFSVGTKWNAQDSFIHIKFTNL